MIRGLSGFAVIVALLCWTPNAHAQKMTEQFIPVGQSPGVSGTYSYIGEIESVDAENRTITVAGPEGPRTIKVTEQTRIWLDRSEQRLTNLVGSITDLRPGRRIEVKYVEYETRDTADWIKVVVPGSG
jgi:hypothetical protein